MARWQVARAFVRVCVCVCMCVCVHVIPRARVHTHTHTHTHTPLIEEEVKCIIPASTGGWVSQTTIEYYEEIWQFVVLVHVLFFFSPRDVLFVGVWICVHTNAHAYMYLYIHKQRERERERER